MPTSPPLNILPTRLWHWSLYEILHYFTIYTITLHQPTKQTQTFRNKILKVKNTKPHSLLYHTQLKKSLALDIATPGKNAKIIHDNYKPINRQEKLPNSHHNTKPNLKNHTDKPELHQTPLLTHSIRYTDCHQLSNTHYSDKLNHCNSHKESRQDIDPKINPLPDEYHWILTPYYPQSCLYPGLPTLITKMRLNETTQF